MDNWSDLDLQLAADQIVLDRYAPVGVIIDQEMEILQFRGQTGAYLEPASGKASFNLLKMARVDLLLLRSAIYQAKRQDESVRKEGLLLKSNNQVRSVNVEVIPFKAPTGGKRYFLVLFEEVTPSAITKLEEVQASLHTKGKQTQLEQENAQLKQDLATTKEYLQSIIEDQSATNESLQVASEEILSSNEELQSTNEELETAQEEIQATNEELNTVNEELQKMTEWRDKKLEIFWLPSYSPQLNLIEILWRFMKYEWIEIDAYCSWQNLVNYVEKVIRDFGEKYVINFA